MESPCIGSLVEIQITTKNFICSFSAKHHLDAHTLDDTSQQVHRCRSSNCRYIVSLNVINHIAKCIETFLNGIVNFMVYGTDEISHFTCLGQIGGSLQTNGKGMKLRPPCRHLSIRFHTAGCITLGNGRNDRTVQTS